MFLVKRSLKTNFKFLKITSRTILSTSKPWGHEQDIVELPKKDQEFEYRMDGSRTYSKWFNPMSFDPRTPDYYETVMTEWQEQPTREDFGESIILSYK